MNKRFYLTEDEKRRILGLHQNSIKKNRINEVEVRDIQNQILALGGYVGKKGADNRLGPDTLTAIYNYLSKMNPIGTKLTTFQPYEGDGSDETFEPPVNASIATTTPSTASTTSSTATTTSSTAATTSNTAATTTNQVKLLDRVPTNQEIRQGFRRRKRLNNRMDRQKRKQLDDLYNQYERIAGSIQKFGSRDDGSTQFKQQMATLENQMNNINAQISKLEAT